MSWGGVTPRARVLTDNDYGGDPDGLVQLAHLLLSPSVEVPVVIGSHLPTGGGIDDELTSASRAVRAAREVALLCGRSDVRVVSGSEVPLASRTQPVESDAADAIVREAMREEASLPLFLTCGGGLTEVASAWLIEPRIAERLTVVWIGGAEYDGIAAPPGESSLEYNVSIDLLATQAVFNDSDLRVWQVPRNVYRAAITSRAELIVRMAAAGELGRHLYEAIGSVVELLEPVGVHLGETFILGDSPLVLLTALWSSFQPDSSSSPSTLRPCPRVLESGAYAERRDGRPIRVFTAIDTRLMLEDLFAKLALHASPSTPPRPGR